ncbi:MAG: hypothetical protein K2N55_02880, partial [Lachnospiraceae bacterium]|nr:hypothetical protein [Lachnospiraceae bacterium]
TDVDVDVETIPLSGLSFYFPAAADAAIPFSEITTTDAVADATALSGSSCCFASAETAAASAADAVADANHYQQFFSSCLKSRL